MNKVLAYMPLHYGKEYVGYAIRSVYDLVDRIVIFYTPQPSFGHIDPEAVNPDNREELKEALTFQVSDDKGKIEWREGWWGNETAHRSAAESLAKILEYDILLAVDYDEVWDAETLRQAIEYVKSSPYKIYRVPFVHLWKGFEMVCRDAAQPTRFTKLSGEGETYIPMDKPVYHFGYAISDELMKYKWTCHGHFDELRKDWLENTWLKWKKLNNEEIKRQGLDNLLANSNFVLNIIKRIDEGIKENIVYDGGWFGDVHPTNENFWTPELFDKNELPDFMKQHPYWSKKW